MIIVFLIFTFLLGSIPFGLLIARVFCGIDPRLSGSKNIGATNIARTCGFAYGVLTLFFDLSKGALAVFSGGFMGFSPSWQAMLGFIAVLGHIYSPFMGGKGGKGVATSVGIFLFLMPVPALVASLACIVLILVSGYVSLGSLLLVTLMPIFAIIVGKWAFLPALCLTMFCVFHKHEENIKRLICGKENPWRKKYFQEKILEKKS